MNREQLPPDADLIEMPSAWPYSFLPLKRYLDTGGMELAIAVAREGGGVRVYEGPVFEPITPDRPYTDYDTGQSVTEAGWIID